MGAVCRGRPSRSRDTTPAIAMFLHALGLFARLSRLEQVTIVGLGVLTVLQAVLDGLRRIVGEWQSFQQYAN